MYHKWRRNVFKVSPSVYNRNMQHDLVVIWFKRGKQFEIPLRWHQFITHKLQHLKLTRSRLYVDLMCSNALPWLHNKRNIYFICSDATVDRQGWRLRQQYRGQLGGLRFCLEAGLRLSRELGKLGKGTGVVAEAKCWWHGTHTTVPQLRAAWEQ